MARAIVLLAIAASATALKHPKSWTGSPVKQPPAPSTLAALDVRGGADLGPLTAGGVVTASCIFGAAYFAQMFFMTEAAGKQYWGAKHQSGNAQVETMTKWFGLAILQQSAVTFFTLKSGFDPVKLCQIGAALWASSFALYLKNYNEGLLTDPSALVVQSVMVLSQAYCGFA